MAGRVIPLPMSRESIGFAHLLAETALFYNNRVLLVKADGRRYAPYTYAHVIMTRYNTSD